MRDWLFGVARNTCGILSEGVPTSVVPSTISAASLLVAGPAATTGAISVKVAALTEGVMKTVFLTKLKIATAVLFIGVLIIGIGGFGTGVFPLSPLAAAKGVKPAAKQDKEKVPAAAPMIELTKIDRTIHKEPAYRTKPRYALLVLGAKAETRMWLVIDGKTLYVDRNGNGDLTEKGEHISATKTNSPD